MISFQIWFDPRCWAILPNLIRETKTGFRVWNLSWLFIGIQLMIKRNNY